MAVILCSAVFFVGCEDDPVETADEGELREDGTRVYNVPNAYFTFEKYELISKGPTDIGDNFSVFSSNTLEIHARCASSLDEITAIIKLYDASGRLVGNYRATRKECGIEANESFVLTADISAAAKESFNVVDVRFEGKTLNKLFLAGHITYNITFVYNNGTPPKMILVGLGDAINEPFVPPEKDGFIFEGWFTDPECTVLYDFSTSDVESDVTLYAGYSLNYERMGQKVVDIAKLATVNITTKSYSSLLWGAYEMSSSEKSGEGIIIKDDAGSYYVLTTSDLLAKDDEHEKVEYSIEDYYGNKYTATVKHSSEAYNLGILSFEKKSALLVSKLAGASPVVGAEIAIASDVDGNGYSPQFGNVLGFEKITHKDSDSSAHDVSFDMMLHDAKTDITVSGRPLFNMNIELVGIQCGTLNAEAVGLENNHVIPWDAIQKYINTYGS